MQLLVLLALLAPAKASSCSTPGRTYHRITIARLATPAPTHVEIEGLVVYRARMRDGDWHVTLIDGQERKAVVEIIPAIPLEVPRKGDRVRVCGISRMDFQHKWGEVHPAERLEVLTER